MQESVDLNLYGKFQTGNTVSPIAYMANLVSSVRTHSTLP